MVVFIAGDVLNPFLKNLEMIKKKLSLSTAIYVNKIQILWCRLFVLSCVNGMLPAGNLTPAVGGSGK